MLQVYILAAGKGTRMRSELPKVLHTVAGKSMLAHVLDTSDQLRPDQTFVVVGHGAEQVKATLAERRLTFVEQQQQLGTAHAVKKGLGQLRDDATVLILFGDVPLVKASTLQRLIDLVSGTAIGLLTVTLNDPRGYGRVIRDEHGVKQIVEDKDCDARQRNIREVNTGIMAVKGRHLRHWLPQIRNDNAQQEYYLPDIIALAVAEKVEVLTTEPEFDYEVLGVNSRRQQAQLERIAQLSLAGELMDQGLALMDPARFDCRGTLSFGRDCVIDINCVFEGQVTLGNEVTIGPNCVLSNATIADGVRIEANTVIDHAEIGTACTVGPFARVRPGTRLGEGARIGNFVETKKADIGAGSKINHLSYIGDAQVGIDVNVGAGTITCNYDGVNKSQTVIGDRSFIGSNSALVAPVVIGADATVAAGSTVTTKVGDRQLAVARQKQRNIDGWSRPEKKK